MTPRQQKSLARYIGAVAHEFGLNDWVMAMHDEPPEDPDALAAVSCVYGRRRANLYFAEDFDKYPPEEQRNAVIHELIHIHTEGVRALVRDTLPSLLGVPAFTTFMAGFSQADEHATDALAAAIAVRFPLWEGA